VVTGDVKAIGKAGRGVDQLDGSVGLSQLSDKGEELIKGEVGVTRATIQHGIDGGLRACGAEGEAQRPGANVTGGWIPLAAEGDLCKGVHGDAAAGLSLPVGGERV